MAKTCIFLDCGRPTRYADRLCDWHHKQRVAGIPLQPIQSRRPMVKNTGAPCIFPDCGKPQKNGGLCVGHYFQRMKGRPSAPLLNASGESERRFWAKVEKTEDCWLWLGPVINSGYGLTSVNGTPWLVHRYTYADSGGQLTPPKVIDHLCRNKLCVRPAHLRQVSHTDNVRAQGLRSNNTSGIRGVSWDKARGQWAGRVNVRGKHRFIGRFATLEAAAKAVAEARGGFYANPDFS